MLTVCENSLGKAYFTYFIFNYVFGVREGNHDNQFAHWFPLLQCILLFVRLSMGSLCGRLLHVYQLDRTVCGDATL